MEDTFKRLAELQKRSKADFSGYRVAAIVETDKGPFAGVNVEFSVYPLCVCAERAAIFSAVAGGAKRFDAMRLITDSADNTGTPCGICRQVMAEVMPSDAPVSVYAKDGKSRDYTVGELLPHGFDGALIKRA